MLPLLDRFAGNKFTVSNEIFEIFDPNYDKEIIFA